MKQERNAKVKDRRYIVVFSIIWLIGFALAVGARGRGEEGAQGFGIFLLFLDSFLWCAPLCAWFDGILFDLGAQGSVFGNWRAMGARWLRDCLFAIIVYHPLMLGVALENDESFWTNLALLAAISVEIGTIAALLGVPYRFFRNMRKAMKKPAPKTPEQTPVNIYRRGAELAQEKRAAQKAVQITTQAPAQTPAQTPVQTLTQTPVQTPTQTSARTSAQTAEADRARRAMEQQAKLEQLAAQLEQQKRAAQSPAEAPKDDAPAPANAAPVFRMSRDALLPMLRQAAGALPPSGPALGTLMGQRALYEEAVAVLPTLAALRHTPPLAAFLYDDEEDPSRLPDHVSGLLGGICEILADADIGVLPALWQDLPPEALVRGWRALSVYRRISAAQQAFDLPLQTLEAHLCEREDVAAWLEARTEGRGPDES